MPTIFLRPLNQEVADLLVANFDHIAFFLTEATCRVFDFEPSAVGVEVSPPPLAATSNTAMLTIAPFVSERDQTRGKQDSLCNELALVWKALVAKNPDLAQLHFAMVDIWPDIAPGAKWGTVAGILRELGTINN